MTYALITLLCVYLLWVPLRRCHALDAGARCWAPDHCDEGNRLPGALCRIAVGPDRQYGVVASVIFLERPKEWTVSARLTRHSEGRGWRKRVAIAIRTALLDNIDPNGVHRG